MYKIQKRLEIEVKSFGEYCKPTQDKGGHENN
jgi:hypothetical protein